MSGWRHRLQARMDDGLRPVLHLGDDLVDAPTLWGGVLRWVEAFRAVGLGPGDRVVTALPSGAAMAQVVLAALWEELTLAPAPPGSDPVQAAATYDPRVAVGVASRAEERTVPWTFVASVAAGPAGWPVSLRTTGPPSTGDDVVAPAWSPSLPAGAPTPAVRLLAPAASVPSWVALSDANVRHVVDGILDTVRPSDSRWLSVLPWWRSDGLLIDLLPAVLAGAEIVRPGEEGPDGCTDVAAIASAVETWLPTHAVLTVAVVRGLVDLWGDLGPLRCAVDGLVTGPGVDEDLAALLSTTRLRTHRGAPELSHLVTLGEPGIWRPGALGRPIGCRLEDDVAGSKGVQGVNLCYGTWHDARLTVEDPGRTLRVTFG